MDNCKNKWYHAKNQCAVVTGQYHTWKTKLLFYISFAVEYTASYKKLLKIIMREIMLGCGEGILSI